MSPSLRSRRIASSLAIWLISLASALSVLAISVFLQWLVYDDWMHRTGRLQILGSLLAAVLAFGTVMRWQRSIRRQKEEMMRRFQTIKWMNDRVCNCLQTIDLLAFLHSEAAEQVKSSVDSIQAVLRDVLEEYDPEAAGTMQTVTRDRETIAMRQ
jgi:hypothetical protein